MTNQYGEYSVVDCESSVVGSKDVGFDSSSVVGSRVVGFDSSSVVCSKVVGCESSSVVGSKVVGCDSSSVVGSNVACCDSCSVVGCKVDVGSKSSFVVVCDFSSYGTSQRLHSRQVRSGTLHLNTVVEENFAGNIKEQGFTEISDF